MSPVEIWWHTVTQGKESERETGEWSADVVPRDETCEIAGPILNAVQNGERVSAIDKNRLAHRTSICMWQCNWS